MSEDKENKYVKDKEVLITAIELETSPKSVTDIMKVRIKTNVGDITWKSRKQVAKIVNGFKLMAFVPINIEDLPHILKDIASITMEKCICKAKVEYSIMKTTDAEGQEVTYRFILSDKILDNWKILTDSSITEENIFEGNKSGQV